MVSLGVGPEVNSGVDSYQREPHYDEAQGKNDRKHDLICVNMSEDLIYPQKGGGNGKTHQT